MFIIPIGMSELKIIVQPTLFFLSSQCRVSCLRIFKKSLVFFKEIFSNILKGNNSHAVYILTYYPVNSKLDDCFTSILSTVSVCRDKFCQRYGPMCLITRISAMNQIFFWCERRCQTAFLQSYMLQLRPYFKEETEKVVLDYLKKELYIYIKTCVSKLVLCIKQNFYKCEKILIAFRGSHFKSRCQKYTVILQMDVFLRCRIINRIY